MTLDGEFFLPLSSKPSRAEITIRGKTAEVSTDTESHSDLTIESIQDKQNIHFDDGSSFVLDNQLTESELAQVSSKTERIISWLEVFTPRRALVLGLILVTFVIVYRLIALSLAPIAVAVFPVSWEKEIGENTYQSIRFGFFEPSRLPESQIERLRTKASLLMEKSELEESVEIHFHESRLLGANALAFPGGPIVVTDGLVKLLKNDDEVLSVIAHEIAHITERHGLQQVVEILGLTILATFVFGASESIVEEATAVAINIWALSESRDFEKEADLEGVRLLNEAGIDPQAFSDALLKLTKHYCKSSSVNEVQDCLEDTDAGWFSSHPTGAERLELLKSAE